MATKEPPKSGLLAKVARFVVNPTTNWSEVDKIDAPETLDPRQADRAAMKAMIELKRRNDFVRQREFNMLRKIRQKELEANGGLAPHDGKPSFFQSSLPSRPDDKAQTIKKINEIEAQMSMQWWSTKHGNSTINSSIMNSSNFGPTRPPDQKPAPSTGVTTVTGNTPTKEAKTGFVNTETNNLLDFTMDAIGSKKTEPMPLPASTPAPTAPAPVVPRPASPPPAREFLAADSITWEPLTPRAQTPVAPAPAENRNSLPPLEFPASPPSKQAVQPGTSLPPSPQRAPVAQPPARPAAAQPSREPAKPAPSAPHKEPPVRDNSPLSEFSPSKLFAIEVEEVTHDPDLEEAAIRFANSDDTGAEQALKDGLHVKDTGLLNEEAWLTLFDLYRATGNQDGYDSLALDYASYFQRSAPTWISFPDQLRQQQVASPASPAPGKPDSPPAWKAPSALGLQSVAALKAALTKSTPPWRIDLTRLSSIEEGAVGPLTELFKSWSNDSKVDLLLEGVNTMADLFHRATPTGDQSVNPAWWHLRLEALRLVHRPDEFEMVALDYCVTYEVSPPSWAPGKCKCKAIDSSGHSQHGGFTIINVASSLPPSGPGGLSGFDGTSAGDLSTRQTTIELSGYISGDALEAIASLDKALEGADVMVISCEKLIRIDFSAAGALLNWVIARRQEGRQVQFVQLHRLILAFFHVIGISDHAVTNVRMH